jgi:hypothetical protein
MDAITADPHAEARKQAWEVLEKLRREKKVGDFDTIDLGDGYSLTGLYHPKFTLMYLYCGGKKIGDSNSLEFQFADKWRKYRNRVMRAKRTNLELLDDTIKAGAPDDYDDEFTTAGEWRRDYLRGELDKRLRACGFLQEVK